MGSLYTPLKIFHFKEKLDSLPPDRQDILPPLHIRIKPTNRCNHNCRYCAYRVENLQLGQDMRLQDSIPRPKMAEITSDIIAMGVKAITFSGGGEPFCYPHIGETLKTLAASPVQFAALTNGALLEGEVAELFAHHGTWLRISMDGWDDASYTRYRGVREGEYSRIMQNIAAFKQRGGTCLLGVSLIINAENHSRIYSQTRRLRDAGVDSVKISPCIVSDDGAANNAWHRPFFDEAKAQAQRAMEELQDTGFEVFDSYPALDEKFAKAYTWCPYLQVLLVIGADLNIYPCQDKAYNLRDGLLGSIANVRFKTFWFANKHAFFKINPSRVCNHHCVANAKNRMILEYLAADAAHVGFV